MSSDGRMGRARAAAAVLARSVPARLAGVSPWTWVLVALVTASAVYFTRLTLDIHRGLGTSTYDYALYDQGTWLLSRFKAPFVTLMGRNLFGDHTSFILLFLVPFYWVVPGAGALLFSQAAAAAVSAVPVFLYARERLESGAMAVVLAAAYLLNPALQWTVLEEFHPDVFLAPLLMFAIYGALTRRWRLYAVCVLLALLVKEDAALVVVPLGLWVTLRRDRTIGLVTMAAGVATALLMTLVVMRGLTGVTFPNAWRIPFGGVGGFLGAVFTRPGEVLDYLRADGRPWYLWQMTAPFGWIWARLPEVAAISAVVLATNVVSNYGYQHQILYHYSLAALPALAMGTVYAAGAFGGRRRIGAVALVAAAAVWSAYLWGPLPVARDPIAYWAPDYEVAVAGREIAAEVPEGAVVSAHYSLTPHLARREQIYSWPNPFHRNMYGTDVSLEGTRMDAASEVEFVVIPATLSESEADLWRREGPAFVLIESNPHWSLYRRADGG